MCMALLLCCTVLCCVCMCTTQNIYYYDFQRIFRHFKIYIWFPFFVKWYRMRQRDWVDSFEMFSEMAFYCKWTTGNLICEKWEIKWSYRQPQREEKMWNSTLHQNNTNNVWIKVEEQTKSIFGMFQKFHCKCADNECGFEFILWLSHTQTHPKQKLLTNTKKKRWYTLMMTIIVIWKQLYITGQSYRRQTFHFQEFKGIKCLEIETFSVQKYEERDDEKTAISFQFRSLS